MIYCCATSLINDYIVYQCCTAVTELTGSAPRLLPPGEEQIYQTGGSFRLTCEATKPVEWKQPILSVIDNTS